MNNPESGKKMQILSFIRDNPFITQKDLADKLNLSRSAVASYVSMLTREGEILGRAYVLGEKGRITCVGGANVDRKIQSIAAIQGGTSNPATVTQSDGGVARNIAENLGRLGAAAAFVSMVGQDKEGEALLSNLAAVGVDVGQVIRSSEHRTGTYTAILDHAGNMSVAFADMEIYDGFTPDRLMPRWKALAQSSLVIVDTNLPEDSLRFLIHCARQESVRLLVAPVSSPKAKRLPEQLYGVDLLVANADEAAAITGISIESEEEIQSACLQLSRRGCKQVVITRGGEGATWMDEGGHFGVVAPYPVDVVDVTGAGDAFVAGIAFALRYRVTLAQACRFGSLLSLHALSTKETVPNDIRPGLGQEWLSDILSDAKGDDSHDRLQPMA